MDSDDELNVEGKSCPMPLFLTKKKLKSMGSGKTLKLIGDFLPAKENIVEFLEKEGHDILDLQEVNDPYKFTIYIKKA